MAKSNVVCLNIVWLSLIIFNVFLTYNWQARYKNNKTQNLCVIWYTTFTSICCHIVSFYALQGKPVYGIVIADLRNYILWIILFKSCVHGLFFKCGLRPVTSLLNVFSQKLDLNPLWPSDAIWRARSGSTLAQAMACCLTAPSHLLNQCWLFISAVLWQCHSQCPIHYSVW